MKKTTLIFIIFAIFSNLLHAQDEETEYDLQNFSIMSEVQSSLTEARGWSLQDNGKWAYGDNRIPFTDSRTNTTRSNAVDELGLDNFIDIELRKIMIDDEQYNVLIKKYKDGEYEFGYLNKNWKSYLSLDFWVFRSEKLLELLPEEIPWNTMYLVDLQCFAASSIKNYERNVYASRSLNLTNYATGAIESFPSSKASYDDNIIRYIQDVRVGTVVNDGNLLFAVYPIKSGDKEVVRFKFVKTYNNRNLVRRQTSPDNWTNLFEASFYEVPMGTYKNFIEESRQYFVPVEDIPSAYTSNYNWGVLRYQIGDYLGAVEAFNKAVDENPKSQDFMLFAYRGNALSKIGRYQDAIANFDRAIALKPVKVVDYSNWVKNYFNRGVAKYYLEDYTGACEDWKKSYDLGYGSASDYLNKFCGREFKY